MNSPKVVNGSILPLMLGALMFTALTASVLNDQRYGQVHEPGYDAVTASAENLPGFYAGEVSGPVKPKDKTAQCKVDELTQSIDDLLMSVPTKVTRHLINAYSATSLSVSI